MFTNQVTVLDIFWKGTLELADIIVLILIVPLIGWVIQHENYIDSIFLKARIFLKSSVQYFTGVMVFTQVLSHFLLIGSIPLIYQFVNDNIKGSSNGIEYLKNLSILRGFALGTLWVVTIPSFSYSVKASGASLISVMVQGFIVSTIAIILSLLLFYYRDKSGWADATALIQDKIMGIDHQVDKGYMNKCIKEFFILFLSFLVISITLHMYVGWDLLVVVPQVTIICVLAYFLLKKSLPKLKNHSKQYFFKDILNKSEELSIYFSVSIFIFAVRVSDIGVYIVDLLNLITSLPWINLYMLLPFLMLLLGFAGLGPLTSMILVGGLLLNLPIPFTPELLVLSLTVGSAISTMMSPIGVSVIMLSTNGHVGKFTLSIKSNYVFCTLLYLISQIYIQVALVFG
ncbi:hypothetical protein [Bacillus sp. MRMR6]|uniref:hypothetical protein n=1 Tax=Bacillus sp. MRMR6 TaxID=1928617 RepID=UPI0011151223|nr:hypothetical protein [Bacillus sp. MRMR6]